MKEVRRPSKKTPLNFLSSQDKMYLKYIFGFTWAAAAVHEVLLADGCDDQDLMAGTCKDVLHGMEYYTTPHPHSTFLGQQLYALRSTSALQRTTTNLESKYQAFKPGDKTLHHSSNRMYSYLAVVLLWISWILLTQEHLENN